MGPPKFLKGTASIFKGDPYLFLKGSRLYAQDCVTNFKGIFEFKGLSRQGQGVKHFEVKEEDRGSPFNVEVR